MNSIYYRLKKVEQENQGNIDKTVWASDGNGCDDVSVLSFDVSWIYFKLIGIGDCKYYGAAIVWFRV